MVGERDQGRALCGGQDLRGEWDGGFLGALLVYTPRWDGRQWRAGDCEGFD